MQSLESKLADAAEVVLIQSEVLEVLQMTEAPIGNFPHTVVDDGQINGGQGQVGYDDSHDLLIQIDTFKNLPFGEIVVDAVAKAVAADEPNSTEENCDWQKWRTKT